MYGCSFLWLLLTYIYDKEYFHNMADAFMICAAIMLLSKFVLRRNKIYRRLVGVGK